MAYSKISTIELINFMSFKRAKLAFDETGIINIKGYNDSGKSAILRGLAVCLMDMFKRSQVKFIRHGEEYFRIIVTFDDNVSIVRDKYSNGQSLYEVYKDEKLVFTTKQGNKLSKIDGVPKVIEDYLGLCVTDSVVLNYQSCVNKLPVVETTGSENYQMFHEVLKMEEIFRANSMINTDKNELSSRIAGLEQEIQRNEVLLEDCGDVTEDLIKVIEGLEEQAKVTDIRNREVTELNDILKKYEEIQNIPSISVIDTRKLKSLERIKSIISSYSNAKDIPQIKKIDSGKLKKLSDISSVVSKLSNVKDIPEVKKVSVARFNTLGGIVTPLKQYEKGCNHCKDIEDKLNEAKQVLQELVTKASESGISFTKCKNCGSFVVVGGEHSHGEI